MNTIELNDLEIQVDTLLESVKQLKSENLSLRNQLGVALREKTYLQQLNAAAVQKIKQIILELKEQLP